MLKFVSDGKQQMITVDQKTCQNLPTSNQACNHGGGGDAAAKLYHIFFYVKKHLQFSNKGIKAFTLLFRLQNKCFLEKNKNSV